VDQDQFQPTARELLERHIAEANQSNRATPETARAPEQEPTRPEDLQGTRYASGLGDYVSQTKAALRNDGMINRDYHEHERNSQKDLEQHVEKTATEPGNHTSAREALEQHFRDAAGEVAQHKSPFARDRDKQNEYER
jgi:hypothetical protein